MSRWAATYYDGETAQAHRVEVEFGTGALGIFTRAGLLKQWDYTTLRRVPEAGRAAESIEVAPSFQSDERLRIDDRAAVKALRSVHRKVDKRRPVNKRAALRGLAWTGAAIGALGFIVLVAIPALAPQIADMIPADREIAMGEKVEDLIADIGLIGEVCETEGGRAALDKMAGKLTANMDLRLPVRIDVVDSDIVNAVALPGGRVLIFAPLLKQSQSADEVAGVLAHEIGHVQLSHPLHGAIRTSASTGVIGLFFGDFMGAGMLAGVGERLLNASHTREAERAADQFAVERMAAANASSAEMAKFFTRMREEHGEGGLFGGYMASHPSFSEREAMLIGASVAEPEPILSMKEWGALRMICASNEDEKAADEIQ